MSGFENPKEKIEDVLDKFEKLEADVYTDGCKDMQAFDTENLVKRKDEDDNDERNLSTQLGLNSDVHILIVEENNLPDLETAGEVEKVTSPSSPEQKEMVSIENYSEHGTVVDNDNKDIPSIDSDDKQKQNKKELKQSGPKISEDVLTKLAQTKKKDETIEFIEYL